MSQNIYIHLPLLHKHETIQRPQHAMHVRLYYHRGRIFRICSKELCENINPITDKAKVYWTKVHHQARMRGVIYIRGVCCGSYNSDTVLWFMDANCVVVVIMLLGSMQIRIKVSFIFSANWKLFARQHIYIFRILQMIIIKCYNIKDVLFCTIRNMIAWFCNYWGVINKEHIYCVLLLNS